MSDDILSVQLTLISRTDADAKLSNGRAGMRKRRDATGNRRDRGLVEPDGIEPTTSCLQSTRSPN